MSAVTVGDTWSVPLVDDLPRSRMVMYAGASGDYNPLHTDEIYATQAQGLPTVIAHGMLTMGMVGTALQESVPHDGLRRFDGRFLARVWPGDALTATFTVSSIDIKDGETFVVLAFDVVNDRAESVLSGSAVAAGDVHLPTR